MGDLQTLSQCLWDAVRIPILGSLNFESQPHPHSGYELHLAEM